MKRNKIIPYLVFIFMLFTSLSNLSIITNVSADPPIGDEPVVPEPYLYEEFIAPPNSFGMGDTTFKDVNISFYRSWLNTTVVWSLQKSVDNIHWLDCSKLLVVVKDWDAINLSEKHTLSWVSDENAYYQLLLKTDDVKSYQDKSISAKDAEDKILLNFSITESEDYNIYYDWSDYKNSAEYGKTAMVKDVISISHKQTFNWRVYTSVKMGKWEKMVIDPEFGYSSEGTGTAILSYNNGLGTLSEYYRGLRASPASNGYVYEIKACMRMSAAQYETYTKVALYETDGTLLGVSTDAELVSGNSWTWYNFTMENIEVVSTDSYDIVALGDADEAYEICYLATKTRATGETYVYSPDQYPEYPTFDNPVSLATISNTASSIYCLYNEGSPSTNNAPTITNPVPANNSINNILTPNTNITTNDIDADTMNLSWYSDFTEDASFTPSYVNSSKSLYATRMPHERSRFYANGSFWFFSGQYLGTDGSDNKIVYHTSTDGVSWSGATVIRDSFYNPQEYGSNGLAGFSIWLEEDKDDIHYSYAQSTELSYRKGHLCANGTITWYADEQSLGGSFLFHSHISLNSSGYPWIWVLKQGLPENIYIYNSSTNDGTWTDTSGSGNQVDFLHESWQGMVVPLPDDKMIAVTCKQENKISGRVWNGTAWESEFNLSSGVLSNELFADDFSMLSFDEHLFFLYREYITDQLRFRHINTTDWSMDNEIYITANIPDNAYGVLSYDRNKKYVYCIWESQNNIYYRRVSGVNFTTMEDTVEWISWDNLYEGRLSVSWADYDDRIVIGFMNTTVDDYNDIYMAYINTTDWTLYGTEHDVNNGSYEKEYTDATLYGVRYRWKVHSDDGTDNISEIYYFTTTDFEPEAPSSFTATAFSISQINLTWTDGVGVDSTRVEWSADADETWDVGNHTLLYNDSAEHYEHTGLDQDEDYFYKAWSWNSTQGVWSEGTTDDATTLTNYPSTVTSPYPANQSIDVIINPTLNITVNDADGDTMDVTFASNYSNSVDWVNYQTNSTVGNGSYSWVFTGANTGTTTYYWKVYCSDGTTNVSETYHFTTATNFTNGDGSEGDPYQITNCEELNWTRDNLTAYYILMNDIDMADCDVTNWNGGKGFIPIYGTEWIFDEEWELEKTPFAGSFNGNNNTISNLFINDSGGHGLGLFHIINNGDSEDYPDDDAIGIVKNLGLTDINITGNGSSVGGIVGVSYGNISECYTTGVVDGWSDVGGLVGVVYTGNITNCYSRADITGTVANSEIGGLLGDWFDLFPINVTNCYSTGLVTTTSLSGGLIGNDDGGGNIINCYWDNETSGQETSDGGTRRTTAQMTYDYVDYDPPEAGLYEDWDLDTNASGSSIWVHDDTGQNDGYPVFRWQYIEAPNTAPTIAGEIPANTSTDISLTPTCNVTVNDADGDTMDVTFASNYSGFAFESLDTHYAGSYYSGIWSDGNYIYVACYADGIRAYSFDENSTEKVWLKDTQDDGGNYNTVWGDGTYIYAACGSDGIRAYTFNENSTEKFWLKDTQDDTGVYEDVFGDENYIYVGVGYSGIYAYSFDGNSFTLEGSQDDGGIYRGIYADGTYIYTCRVGDGISAYTFDGADFALRDTQDDGGTYEDAWGDGTYIYTVNGYSGIYAYTYDGDDFVLKDTDYTEDGVGDEDDYLDVWGDNYFIYTASADGVICAYSFDGTTLTLIGQSESSHYLGIWADVNYIYVGCDYLGIQSYKFTDWVNYQTNSTVGNGSYSWSFTGANVGTTTYWWKVYCDDGTENVSEWYYFTTLDFLWIDITNTSWSLGNVVMGASIYTNETSKTFIADMDNTTVNTDLKLQITNDGNTWNAATSGNSPASNIYRLNASIDTWLNQFQIVTTSATTISADTTAGQNETFDLRFDAPTSSTTGSLQTIATTATLVKH